jgi:hypothetical protein
VSKSNKSAFVDTDHTNKVEAKFRDEYARLTKERKAEVRSHQAEVERELAKINSELEEYQSIEDKYRAAGYLPSQAEELIRAGKVRPVGQVFKFFGAEYRLGMALYTCNDRFYVRTPFNTIVLADEYIDTLQNQLVQVARLNSTLTSGSFFGLIKLAFTNLITNLCKGKSNG